MRQFNKTLIFNLKKKIKFKCKTSKNYKKNLNIIQKECFPRF